MTPTWRVLVGDVRERLATLPDASVQMVCTSPPYWGLRDYGATGQLGLEPTPDAYVAALVGVFQGFWRVLKDDGVVWLNLGDSYAGSGPSGASYQSETTKRRAALGVDNGFRISKRLAQQGLTYAEKKPVPPAGLKSKDLVGIPWMVAFALRSAGWYLRADIIWSKPNPMPESVTDRPTKAHEYIFLLSKSQKYFYDAEAIAEDSIQAGRLDAFARPSRMARKLGRTPHGNELSDTPLVTADTRNCRSVWTITTQPYPDAHFATFPEAIPERCIKAGSRLGDTVLDPFCGSGTTGQVAIQLGRSFIGIELNPAYAELSRTRINGAAPLFATEQPA